MRVGVCCGATLEIRHRQALFQLPTGALTALKDKSTVVAAGGIKRVGPWHHHCKDGLTSKMTKFKTSLRAPTADRLALTCINHLYGVGNTLTYLLT